MRPTLFSILALLIIKVALLLLILDQNAIPVSCYTKSISSRTSTITMPLVGVVVTNQQHQQQRIQQQQQKQRIQQSSTLLMKSTTTRATTRTTRRTTKTTTTPMMMMMKKPNKIVVPLLEAASQPQSLKNQKEVEKLIHEISIQAKKYPSLQLQRPIQPGIYRTIWSTVTANNIIGKLLNHPPSNVLGGPSWQIISDNLQYGENIVYWPQLDLRMVGLARLSPIYNLSSSSKQQQQHQPNQKQKMQIHQKLFNNNNYKKNNNNDNNNINKMIKQSQLNGYELQICGLEFRWGAKGCPEIEQQQQQQQQINVQKNNKKKNIININSNPKYYNNNDDNNNKKKKIKSDIQNKKNKKNHDQKWQLFYFNNPNQQLLNGVGTLHVLYNDGVIRITKDIVQQNTYIHMKEFIE